MGRWGSNTHNLLEQTAMELYLEHGFTQTTVAEIAERAGLTERTFFRHFADKREVLFGGSSLLQEIIIGVIETAPKTASPINAVTAGLEDAGRWFQTNPERSRKRQTIIDSNPELQARELSKLATLASAIADALRKRGVADPMASLTAEVGIVVFRTAFERLIHETNQPNWSQLVRQSLKELKAVIAGK